MPQVRISLAEACGDLPPVCLCCGQPAAHRIARLMTWRPRWISIFFFLGVLPYFILLLFLTRTVRLNVPFCDRHKHHWRLRSVLIVASFALVIGVTYAALHFGQQMPVGPWRRLFTVFAFLAGCSLVLMWALLVYICQMTAVQTHEINDAEIVLDGVSPTFIDALIDWDVKQVRYPRTELVAGDQIVLLGKTHVRPGAEQATA